MSKRNLAQFPAALSGTPGWGIPRRRWLSRANSSACCGRSWHPASERTEVCPPEWKPSIRFVWSPGLRGLDRNIPHETGLELSHISYEKGCYTGQEIVERVRSRGHANRRLTGLQFLDGKAPAAGTKLLIPGDPDGKEAGQVTSAGFSPLVGRRIGLGYVRREHSALGTQLDASGSTAEVISLPLLEKQSSV